MISDLSPTCPPVQPGCSECFGPHLSPSCFPLHSRFFARVISGLSPTCPSVISGCSAVLWSACSLPWFQPTCLQVSPSTFWMLWVECFGPRSVRMISGLSPTCLQLSPNTLWMLWLSPTTLWIPCPQACLPLVSTCPPFVSQYSVDALSALVRAFPCSCLPLHSTVSHLSPGTPFRTCSAFVFYNTLDSLPQWFHISLWLHLSPFASQYHSACTEHSGPHDFKLVSHLCLPLHSGWSQCRASHDFTLVPAFHCKTPSFCMVCGTTTFNQPPPSTFACSGLKYHEVRLIYKQTGWGQCWYNCLLYVIKLAGPFMAPPMAHERHINIFSV